MAERLNRDPTYDLGVHIATGRKGPFSGAPEIRPFDMELDRNDPMDPAFAGIGSGNFDGQSAEAVQQANLTQALGLDSGDGKLGQAAVDMSMANDCLDEPTKGGISYGPRNTGGY